MDRRVRLVVLPGGRPAGAPGGRRARLRVVLGGASPAVQRGLAEAVAAAREMRRERERRIARALEGPEDHGP
jgi:hypothetical protein